MPPLRACKNCGKPFPPRGGGGKPQVHCSDVCRRAYARTRSNARKFAKRPTECEQCGGAIEQSTVGAPKRFCASKCKRKFHNRKRARARVASPRPAKRPCAQCGEVFRPKRRDRMYCYNASCPVAAYRERKRQGLQPRIVERERKCDGCGTPYTAKHPRARWCSKKCAQREKTRRSNRRKRGLAPGDYSDRQVFEKDDWICWLCHKEIQAGAAWPDPKCSTVDHMLPILYGGDDDFENARAAHWGCNRERGTQLALG